MDTAVGVIKKNPDKPEDDQMRTEYDVRGGVRGKYYERYKQGPNVVLLAPDMAKDLCRLSADDAPSRRHACRRLLINESGSTGRQFD